MTAVLGSPPTQPATAAALRAEQGQSVQVARWTPSGGPRDTGTDLPLRVGGFDVPLSVMALPILPGGQIEIASRLGQGRGAIRVAGPSGRLRRSGRGSWTWTAPSEPGFYPLRVTAPAARDTVRLTFIVLRPATDVENGSLNGYRIGTYRQRPTRMSPRYEPPVGFIEATEEDHDILVSPNFRLGQFLCKDPGDPRYLLVSPRLLIKLEALLAAVNEAGHVTPSLAVMSGFRTPAYNRAIGNVTDFSRHLWGDAADVYVDNDEDGQMDDLNGDGRLDVRDARWLGAVVDRLMADSQGRLEPGGLSAYRRNAAHGPFLHVDTRGSQARW